MRQYLSNILKCDTSSDDTKENIDHWFDSFETFHKYYIIIPKESYYSSFTEESRYTAVRSPPGFINKETKQDVI